MENIIRILKPGKTYTIAVNGEQAVKLAYKLQNGKCYTQIKINSVFSAQCEVVIDSDGEYNGRPNKWVNFSYIPCEMVLPMINWLSNNGFDRCFAVISSEDNNSDEIPFTVPVITELYDIKKDITDTDYKPLPCLYGYTKTDLNTLYNNIFRTYQFVSFDDFPGLKSKLYEDCISLSGYISRY